MFSPDGTRVVTTYYDRSVRVWGVDGTSQSVIKTGYNFASHSVVFSPDGTRIVTTENLSTTAEVWWVDSTEKPVVLAGHTGIVTSAVFSPDGTRIVTASADGTARVWQADGTGEPVVLAGHGGRVGSAAFSPDGMRIVTTSSNSVRVWQADGMGEPVVLSGHRNVVTSAVFSPDGTRVVSTSRDQRVRVWRWTRGGSGNKRVPGSLLRELREQLWEQPPSPPPASMENVDPRTLVGLSMEQVREKVGSPLRDEGATWTYRTANGLVTLTFEDTTADGSSPVVSSVRTPRYEFP